MGRNNNYLIKYNKMKKLWEKILAWLQAKWNAFKTWFLGKPLTWLKKNWMVLVNYLVIVLAYNNVYGKDGVLFTEVLLGLWIFASVVSAVYYIFIKK